MARTTDPQKQAVYHAEYRVRHWLARDTPSLNVFGSSWVPETEIRFGDIASVQRYVDAVLRLIGMQDQPVTVRARQGETKAHYEPWSAVIAVPPMPTTGHGQSWAMRETVVLHELAHHLARGDAHGPRFARAHLYLWEVTGHPVISHLHHIAMLEEGVSISPSNEFPRSA